MLRLDEKGNVDLVHLEELLRTKPRSLVSLMHGNNEIGNLLDLQAVGELCAEYQAILHSDTVQTMGHYTHDLQELKAHFIVGAAHKFHGPKGVGLLYLRAGLDLERLQHGGSHENERRPGTENVAAIVGMARAAEVALPTMDAERGRQAALRDELWRGIQAAFPAAVRNWHPDHTLANTLNISFPGLEGEGLLMNLDLAGICASSGSACLVGSIQPSHVLLAMGVEPALAAATVRFSLGKQTFPADIETTIQRLPEIFARLAAAHA